MSTLAGNAARMLAACLPMLCVSGEASAGSCVSASWYHEGSHTASGERYRPDGLTAAHRSLRLGTRVLVTNRRNGRTVEVRINDRGPAAWTRRGIDLSRGAARALGMMGSGVAPVCLQVVDGGGRASRHAEVAGDDSSDIARAERKHARRGKSRRLASAAARRHEKASIRRNARAYSAKKAYSARSVRREADDDA